MYWEKDLETLERDQLTALQLTRLRQTLAQASRGALYARRLEEAGLTPEALRCADDVRRIPLTEKQDLRDSYPFGLLCVDREQGIRLHSSSGTTGQPTVVVHNRHDLDSWANLVARSMYCAGVRSRDTFQNICGYGLFTGGLGFQYGAERLGCLTIPAGAGNTRRQVKILTDCGSTVIHAIPSYLPRLHQGMAEMGVAPGDTEVRIILTGAEPHSEGTRLRLQELFGVPVFNSYGLTEMNGPGVGFECEYQTGLHVWEDAFLLELLHPETLAPVAEGDIGEVVLTTLDRQAMPMLRYRTRDLARLLSGPCPCGRTHRRISRILGRSDDMVIIKGCNVFPVQIEQVLMRFPELGHDYLIRLISEEPGDQMRIDVEMRPEFFTDDWRALDGLCRRLAEAVCDEVLVTPKVKLVEPGSLPRADGKAIRVLDERIGS